MLVRLVELAREALADVFGREPVVTGEGGSIPVVGDFERILGVPVLLVRGSDGQARAFLNVCRHRGAQICPHGSGSARVFSCPYHGWTYNNEGELVGVAASNEFGECDTEVQLPGGVGLTGQCAIQGSIL